MAQIFRLAEPVADNLCLPAGRQVCAHLWLMVYFVEGHQAWPEEGQLGVKSPGNTSVVGDLSA